MDITKFHVLSNVVVEKFQQVKQNEAKQRALPLRGQQWRTSFLYP